MHLNVELELLHCIVDSNNIVISLQPWQDTADNSWLREYPETLVQFLLFLYRNITSFSVVCTSQEFLEKLVAVLFPKRRNLAKFQEVQRWVCSGNLLPLVAYMYRRISVYNIGIISISDTVCNGATKTLVVNIEVS